MIKPVYVFSGFLDSGKTSAIKEVLYDPRFNEGESTLIIAMEEGDEVYDDKFKKYAHAIVEYFDFKDFTHAKMQELNKKYAFERVFIEFNGMEDDLKLYANGFIEEWELAQTLTVFDATKFKLQALNWRQFVYNHVVNAEVAVFNRSDDCDRKYIRNNLKAINPHLELIFEDKDGNVDKAIEDDLFVGDDIYVNDLDYGLWYMDALDNPLKYENKKLSLNVTFLEDLPQYDMALIMGRRAMVCCDNDIADIGLTVVGVDKKAIKKGEYYRLHGVIHCLDDESGYKTCLLYVDKQEKAPAPDEELVSFN